MYVTEKPSAVAPPPWDTGSTPPLRHSVSLTGLDDCTLHGGPQKPLTPRVQDVVSRMHCTERVDTPVLPSQLQYSCLLPAKVTVRMLAAEHCVHGCPVHLGAEQSCCCGHGRDWATQLMPLAAHSAAETGLFSCSDGAKLRSTFMHVAERVCETTVVQLLQPVGHAGPNAPTSHEYPEQPCRCGHGIVAFGQNPRSPAGSAHCPTAAAAEHKPWNEAGRFVMQFVHVRSRVCAVCTTSPNFAHDVGQLPSRFAS